MALLAKALSVPWLIMGALMVLLRKIKDVALLNVPGPLSVEPLSNSVVCALLKSGVKLAVALTIDKVPVPLIVPAVKLNVPLLTVNVRPLAMVIVPLVLKVELPV